MERQTDIDIYLHPYPYPYMERERERERHFRELCKQRQLQGDSTPDTGQRRHMPGSQEAEQRAEMQETKPNN